ncbi:MAG: hypothetical protein V4479_01035 [Actinomycetota bacterium]
MPECSVVRKSWGELTIDELYSFMKLRAGAFFVEQRSENAERDDREHWPNIPHIMMFRAAA